GVGRRLMGEQPNLKKMFGIVDEEIKMSVTLNKLGTLMLKALDEGAEGFTIELDKDVARAVANNLIIDITA
ncbi:MAG: hypothetical protein WBB13_12445, partial [Tabrizicola sp.]